MSARAPSDRFTHKPPDWTLDDGFHWEQERKWNCSIHEEPQHEYWNDDGYWDDEPSWEWAVYGCTCDRTAKWVPTGFYVAVPDLNGISKLLYDLYLPAVMETLNKDVLLLDRLEPPDADST
jgi:hypothetical protein